MMTETRNVQTERKAFIHKQIKQVDGRGPDAMLSKHGKMASAPLLFFRGSAHLFYADLAAQHLTLPDTLTRLPLTCILGDCHTGNFGFMTEEGSHGDDVIFAPNDYDDACVGYAGWDILRFMVSVILTMEYCQGIKSGKYSSNKNLTHKPVIDEDHAYLALDAFIDGYLMACQRIHDDPATMHDVVDDIVPGTRLHKFYRKACERAAGGEEFLTKSALAKAVKMNDDGLVFRRNSEKYSPLAPHYYQTVYDAFSPYMDEDVIDIVERNQAGIGSNNLKRFYFLVGPAQPHNEASFARCHIVEVKQQRIAAPLAFFTDLTPINRLNPAHLTARCQRRMQRRPDLLLDEVEWQKTHWLVRSRHHARVSISAEDIGMGNRSVEGGFVDFAQLCGESIALSHARGDRRSVTFEKQVLDTLPHCRNELIDIATQYAQQVITDHQCWLAMLKGENKTE